jgi:Domain of unknown function (DUF4261)
VNLSIAFIPLNPGARLSSAAIVADFTQQWPKLPKPDPEPALNDQIAFRVGDCDVIIAPMPAPIPASDLEGPSRTSRLWPDAESALRGHDRHLIVTVTSPEGPIERSRLLTQVCASILATCAEAPGVFWTNAALLVPSKIFRDFATKVLPGMAPIYIWIDFRVGRSANGKTSGFTTGLAELGHMEFETESSPEPPAEFLERLFGLANYVLEHGPVIEDGHTIGEDENERIRVVYAPSAFGHDKQVMRLEYEPADSMSDNAEHRDKKKTRLKMTLYGYVHAALTLVVTIALGYWLHSAVAGFITGAILRHVVLDVPILIAGILFLFISDRILQSTFGLQAFDEVDAGE